jgi:hypothetical protein
MASAAPPALGSGGPHTGGHESALLDYASRLANHKEGRRAIHVRLSRLSPGNRLEHHLRIVMNTFEPLLRKFNGQLFRLWNNDIVVGVKDARIADIDDYVVKLRFLFSEDPALLHEAAADEPFCVWYDMQNDHPAFLILANLTNADATEFRRRQMAALLAPDDSSTPHRHLHATGEGAAFTPLLLDRFESALRIADTSAMIERQMICTLAGQAQPTPVLCEHFISIRALQNKLLPGIDCLSDRWLFQHLSQTLDYRMLAALPQIAKSSTAPITININISTILSPQFLKFDAAIRRITQKTIILELQSIDLFADMGAYIFARDFAHDRGYGIALDGLNALTFPYMDRAKLKLDFEKIIWSPELCQDLNPERRASFLGAIQQAGAARIILCRCDDQNALDFGIEAGIKLFQGRHVDHLLSA